MLDIKVIFESGPSENFRVSNWDIVRLQLDTLNCLDNPIMAVEFEGKVFLAERPHDDTWDNEQEVLDNLVDLLDT